MHSTDNTSCHYYHCASHCCRSDLLMKRKQSLIILGRCCLLNRRREMKGNCCRRYGINSCTAAQLTRYNMEEFTSSLKSFWCCNASVKKRFCVGFAWTWQEAIFQIALTINWIICWMKLVLSEVRRLKIIWNKIIPLFITLELGNAEMRLNRN